MRTGGAKLNCLHNVVKIVTSSGLIPSQHLGFQGQLSEVRVSKMTGGMFFSELNLREA